MFEQTKQVDHEALRRERVRKLIEKNPDLFPEQPVGVPTRLTYNDEPTQKSAQALNDLEHVRQENLADLQMVTEPGAFYFDDKGRQRPYISTQDRQAKYSRDVDRKVRPESYAEERANVNNAKAARHEDKDKRQTKRTLLERIFRKFPLNNVTFTEDRFQPESARFTAEYNLKPELELAERFENVTTAEDLINYVEALLKERQSPDFFIKIQEVQERTRRPNQPEGDVWFRLEATDNIWLFHPQSLFEAAGDEQQRERIRQELAHFFQYDVQFGQDGFKIVANPRRHIRVVNVLSMAQKPNEPITREVAHKFAYKTGYNQRSYPNSDFYKKI